MTRSVRLEKEIDEAILEAAEVEGVSVNLLVSRILRRFVDWEIRAERFGFVEIPPELPVMMGELIPEEQLRELGRWFGNTGLREFILFWFKELNFDTLARAFPELMAKYGRVFTYEHTNDGDRGVMIIRHNGGAKWSAFYEEALKTAFRELLGSSVSVEVSQNNVTAKYLLNKQSDS